MIITEEGKRLLEKTSKIQCHATKIICNTDKRQIIFNSYHDLKLAFDTTDYAIRRAEISGKPLRDKTTGEKWYVDKLFE